MIADLTFDRPDADGVRCPRFVPHASIPISAACLIASSLREMLRELFGSACEVALGEPTAIDPGTWGVLTSAAHCFLTRGRQTDVVLVLSDSDARRLVLHALGEVGPIVPGALSALEWRAMERFAARCDPAFEPLCAERRGPSHAVAASELPACVEYFDVRVRAPIALTLGVGIVRDLPDPGPSGALSAEALARVPLELRAECARGTIDVRRLLDLRVGDVVRLDTKVASPAVLKVGSTCFATGACGIRGAYQAFSIDDVDALALGDGP